MKSGEQFSDVLVGWGKCTVGVFQREANRLNWCHHGELLT